MKKSRCVSWAGKYGKWWMLLLNWEKNKKCIHSFGNRLLRKPRKEFCDDMKTDFRKMVVSM